MDVCSEGVDPPLPDTPSLGTTPLPSFTGEAPARVSMTTGGSGGGRRDGERREKSREGEGGGRGE